MACPMGGSDCSDDDLPNPHFFIQKHEIQRFEKQSYLRVDHCFFGRWCFDKGNVDLSGCPWNTLFYERSFLILGLSKGPNGQVIQLLIS